MLSKEQARNLLIYLYLQLDKRQDKIMIELLEKKLGVQEADVNAYLSENNIDTSKFITIVDSDYPDELKGEITNPTFVIEK